MQFIGDNVDHNTRTLDGKNTFHGMGVVAAVTPSCPQPNAQVKRSVGRKKVGEIIGSKGIPIEGYFGKAVPSPTLRFSCYKELKAKASIEDRKGVILDLAWLSSWQLRNNKMSSWSGFMQGILSSETNFKKSSIVMLPIIDLQSSDPTCIFSTLKFIEAQATRLSIKSPCITFDQPLWYKALAIIDEQNMSIVCRLVKKHKVFLKVLEFSIKDH